MTTPHRTLQMALDALDAITDDVDGTGLNTMPSFDKAIDAIAALREALAPDHLRDVAEKVAPAAPVVREPVIDEMDAVASKYAHKMALDLECVLSDYSGKWWDAAMQTLGEYRSAMNAIHERESPTHMGEPVLPQHGITGGGNG